MNKINQTTIAGYIHFLFKKKHGKEAPAELVAKWQSLTDEKIQQELQGLYASWSWSLAQGLQEENKFLQSLRPMEVKSEKPLPDTKTKKSIPKWVKALMTLIPIFLGLYLTYQYYGYKNADYLYALTNNIAVRDGNTNIVGRMDLYSRKVKNDSVASIERIRFCGHSTETFIIDGNEIEFNRVILDTNNFWGYLTNNPSCVGYVNASTVTEEAEEQRLHKSVFYTIKDNADELRDLKYIQRKIMVNCIREKSSLKKLQIAAPCRDNGGRRTLGILRQTLVENEKYCMIAKLSNGHYYRFLGDAKNEFYREPEIVQYKFEGDESTSELEGDYLFRYNGKSYDIIECQTGRKLGQSVNNNEGAVDYFEFIKPVEPEPESSPVEILFDSLGNQIMDIING
ncbi:MAG TPA: hypothetical protein PLU10_11660 [Chitinophagaceae bacterium]|nr:hypothetical protein [Chitinophagaceae bacterium]